MNSRNKGKRGELEFAAYLRERGFDAKRGQQFRGGTGSPDVTGLTMYGVHPEVKRTNRLELYAALDQATTDGDGLIPVVFYRSDNHPWVAILSADDLLKLVKPW